MQRAVRSERSVRLDSYYSGSAGEREPGSRSALHERGLRLEAWACGM